jgi:hypothetical protein
MSDATNFREWLRARAAAASARGYGGAPETATGPVQEHRTGTDAHVAPAAPSTPALPRNPAFPNLRAPWPKGVSGNPSGRPKATRDWLAGDFIAKLAADFQEHGAGAIRRARVADPGAYLGLVARLVPKDLLVTNDTGHSSILARLGPAELAELRRQLEEALTLARAGHPLVLPPILDAKPGDDGDDG